LKETDFSDVNLSASVFSDCDLTGTNNYSIDPEFNKLKKAKFSAFNLGGLLYKHQLDIDYNN